MLKQRGVEVDVKTGMKPDEVKAVIGNYDGLAVRSATKVTADILKDAHHLKVIGRAGAGVDTIDVPVQRHVRQGGTLAHFILQRRPSFARIAAMTKIFTACLGTETNTFASIPTGHQDRKSVV